MKHRFFFVLSNILVVLGTLSIGCTAIAQENVNRQLTASELQARQDKQERQDRPAFSYYKLEYTIFEVQDGKRVNPHSYLVMIEEGGKSVVKAGTRVPISTGGKEGSTNLQYIDIGFNLDSRIRVVEGGVSLIFSLESSSIAAPSQTSEMQPPLIRQVRSEFTAFVVPGKPTLVASVDDVMDNHRLQMEVTITKLK